MSRRAFKMPPGWAPVRTQGFRTREWRHEGHGLAVRHCGHPTALRPYYVATPDWLHQLGAFSLLEQVMQAAELTREAIAADAAVLADDWECYSLRMRALGMQPSRREFDRVMTTTHKRGSPK